MEQRLKYLVLAKTEDLKQELASVLRLGMNEIVLATDDRSITLRIHSKEFVERMAGNSRRAPLQSSTELTSIVQVALRKTLGNETR